MPFPDPDLARESIWMPFLLNELKVDKNSILVGHSSGAIAAMRLAEEHHVLGSVLVSAYHTDLGIENEKKSGYFDKPWNWQNIKENQHWAVLFASQDDPWISIDQPRHIHSRTLCKISD